MQSETSKPGLNQKPIPPPEYYEPQKPGEAPISLNSTTHFATGGTGTLKNPEYQQQLQQGTMYVPQKADVTLQSSELRLMVVPTGVVVFLDSNPHARYNHSVSLFNNPCNIIKGIKLIKVWIPGFVSKAYDALIYFYEVLFEVLTCTDKNDRCKAFLLLCLYFVLLVGPYIAIITLALSSIFFLWYIAGNIVRIVNVCKLGDHQYQENMVPASQAPPFQAQNEFFTISAQNVSLYYQQKGNLAFYQALQSRGTAKFMAYREQMIENNYTYMISFKMIAFHVIFMALSALCTVGSVKIFPALYGVKS